MIQWSHFNNFFITKPITNRNQSSSSGCILPTLSRSYVTRQHVTSCCHSSIWNASGANPAARAPHGQRPGEKFGYPDGVAVAPDGTVYVVDTDSTILKKISPAGQVTRLGVGSLVYPTGVALAPNGTVYVADAGNHSVVRIGLGGEVSQVVSRGLVYPCGLALGPDGALYIADAGYEPGSGKVFRLSPGGHLTPLATGLHKPSGVALAPDGTIYLADTAHDSLLKIDARGELSPVVGSEFNKPHGLAVGANGAVYVADTYNNRVQRIDPTGSVTTVASGFNYPLGLAIDQSGVVYVTDTGNNVLKKITPAGVVLLLPDAAPKAPAMAGNTGSRP